MKPDLDIYFAKDFLDNLELQLAAGQSVVSVASRVEKIPPQFPTEPGPGVCSTVVLTLASRVALSVMFTCCMCAACRQM